MRVISLRSQSVPTVLQRTAGNASPASKDSHSSVCLAEFCRQFFVTTGKKPCEFNLDSQYGS